MAFLKLKHDYGESFRVYLPTSNSNFMATSRTCYIGVLLYVVGFVVLGASLQNHHIAALIIGWGLAQIGILVTTVAVCKSTLCFCLSTQYTKQGHEMHTVLIAFLVTRFVQNEYLSLQFIVLNRLFHHASQGEISGLINLTRTLGGGSASL